MHHEVCIASIPSDQGAPVMSVQNAPEADMIAISGGAFVMGSDHFYTDEAPAHKVRVDDFLIDSAPVTNREFAKFLQAQF